MDWLDKQIVLLLIVSEVKEHLFMTIMNVGLGSEKLMSTWSTITCGIEFQ